MQILFDKWPKNQSDKIDKKYFNKVSLLYVKGYNAGELNWKEASD